MKFFDFVLSKYFINTLQKLDIISFKTQNIYHIQFLYIVTDKEYCLFQIQTWPQMLIEFMTNKKVFWHIPVQFNIQLE